ncbi:hypothetical protein PVL29_013418 [Vitis rotundifolia]|uniref:Uncharacterized protein n=1 Tax=Vitis rotundifolia TaxID=103349 RepID=A0AA38ZLU6_VITRO|nr:hypothetical protein PVL29_013418 [Vitis rotundifolia]
MITGYKNFRKEIKQRMGELIGGSGVVLEMQKSGELKRVSEDSNDELSNPEEVIQFGLAKNKLSLDLARDWHAEDAKDSILSGRESSGSLSMGRTTN